MRFAILALVGGYCCLTACGQQSSAAGDVSYAEARRHLVKLLSHRGISDERVLQSMGRVPRHAFVPAPLAPRAYEDEALPIAEGQTISQPYIVALMTELLHVKAGAKVLEIGTGSGYQAAVLSDMGAKVYSVEISAQLARAARLRLAELGYHDVHVRVGDGSYGWPEYSPFDAVIVTAAAPEIPRRLVRQLVDGGIIVIPLDRGSEGQVLVQGIKRKGHLRTRQVTGVRFVPMRGAVTKGGSGNTTTPAGETYRRGPRPLANPTPPWPTVQSGDRHGGGVRPVLPSGGSVREGAPPAR